MITNSRLRHFSIVILILGILLSACGSSEKPPPYFGVFIQNGNDYIEILEGETIGIPYPFNIKDPPAAPDSQPVITFWEPEVVFDYLSLWSIEDKQELRYTINPMDDGIFKLRPSDPLEPGLYCFIQGNPLASFLSAWCFRFGNVISGEGNGSVSDMTSTITPAPEFDPIQVQTQVAQAAIDAPEPDVCFNTLCFSYPEGEDYGAVPSVLPAELEMEWFAVPEHDDFTFYDYTLSDTFHKAHIAIYQVAEFLEVNPVAEETVAELEAFLALKPKDPDHVPLVLPVFNAAQMVTVQVEHLTFEGGSGVRFVSQYGQAAWPINNSDLFYAYQGLTDDGLYLISAILPVSHPSLPADGDTFIGDEYDAFINGFEVYLLDVESQLGNEDPESFFPKLTALDEMLETMQVEKP